ncbi:hypothetical protein PF002_g16518 [Phytophthora fragariae]|uniref:Uncharacterized protein n=1 Tax=Phytophthora fragariae TaxID=53985 RepID=A0A6A3YIY0_9STRA|nr:hypothetical protein PF002_g16518 [Phytophthora fragariae]
MGGLKVYQRRLRGRSKQNVAAEENVAKAAVAVERGNPIPPQDAVMLNIVGRSTADDPLRSAELLFSSNAYVRDTTDLEEPDPGSGVSAVLLKEYTDLGTPSRASRRHDQASGCPISMLEWMMEMQSWTEEACITYKANEKII